MSPRSHQHPPTAQCPTGPFFTSKGGNHQTMKHNMKCVYNMQIDALKVCICVCVFVRADRTDEQPQQSGEQKVMKSQVSSEGDFTWRVKTERHAKWPNYCNEKRHGQLLSVIEAHQVKTYYCTYKKLVFSEKRIEMACLLSYFRSQRFHCFHDEQ